MDEQIYRERLARDVAKWRRDGIIDATQESQILAYAGASTPRAIGALRLGWLVTAVSIIGALVLGGGVVLLFAANWEQMPDAFRTLAVIVAMIAAYAAGYALVYRYDMQRIGSALILLGVILYQAGVFLIAQIYNMPVESPGLFLLAAIGTLPVAYLFGSRIVLLIAIGWTVAWVVAELAQRYEDTPQFEASLLIIGVFGIALYAVGRLHSLRESLVRFGEVYMLAGTLLTLALVYVFSFGGVWDEMIDSGIESYAAPVLVYVAIGLTAALIGAGLLLRRDDSERLIEAAILGAVLLVAAVVATWPAWTGYALVFNGIYFGAASAIVVRGYLRADERYINFGLAAIALGLMTRYVDVFWSMLATSGFFMVGGALLLLVAFGLERLRRGLIESMGDDGDATPNSAHGAREATI